MIGSVRLMPHIINICILIKNETKLIGIWEMKGDFAMKRYPPKRPLNTHGVCYTDKLCDIKSNCSKCNNLNPNGSLEDLKSGEKKAIGSW